MSRQSSGFIVNTDTPTLNIVSQYMSSYKELLNQIKLKLIKYTGEGPSQEFCEILPTEQSLTDLALDHEDFAKIIRDISSKSKYIVKPEINAGENLDILLAKLRPSLEVEIQVDSDSENSSNQQSPQIFINTTILGRPKNGGRSPASGPGNFSFGSLPDRERLDRASVKSPGPSIGDCSFDSLKSGDGIGRENSCLLLLGETDCFDIQSNEATPKSSLMKKK